MSVSTSPPVNPRTSAVREFVPGLALIGTYRR